MDQNLYGHPDAGGWWERHAEDKVVKEDFTRIENMPSMFWHPKMEVLLIICVDDFKMAGRASRVLDAWVRLRKHIKMSNPESAIRFLGIHQQVHRGVSSGSNDYANYLEYFGDEFLEQCCERYLELSLIHI